MKGGLFPRRKKKNMSIKTLAIKQNPSGRYGVLSYKLIREIPEAPKTTQALHIPLGSPPESDDATLLWRTPHILIEKTKEREGGGGREREKNIKLELDWKLPPCWQAQCC